MAVRRIARGLLWEEVCRNSLERLRQDGRLYWFRNATPMVRVGEVTKSGTFPARYGAQAPPDYTILTAGGCAMLVDAKDCKVGRWEVRQVKDHQMEAMRRWKDMGGTAGIFLRMPDRSRWYIRYEILLPCWQARDAWAVGDVPGFEWEATTEGQPNFDWLTPFERGCPTGR